MHYHRRRAREAARWQTQAAYNNPRPDSTSFSSEPHFLAVLCPKKHTGTSTIVRLQRPSALSPMWPAAGAMSWEQGGIWVCDCGHRLGAMSPCVQNAIVFHCSAIFSRKMQRLEEDTIALKPGKILQ